MLVNPRSRPLVGHRLAVVRLQEADQRISDAADQIVAFLAAAPGRVTDTALSSDEVREIVVVGYARAGTTPCELDAGRQGHADR